MKNKFIKIVENLEKLNKEQWVKLLTEIDTGFFFEYFNRLPKNIQENLKNICSERLIESFKEERIQGYDTFIPIENFFLSEKIV